MLRELERQMKSNADTISKPVLFHPDQVRYYFNGYMEYLQTALSFPELPQRSLFERRLQSKLVIHRDNLGDLAGRVGELAGALEASLSGAVKELSDLHSELARVKADLQRIIEENADLKKRLQDLKALGGKLPPG